MYILFHLFYDHIIPIIAHEATSTNLLLGLYYENSEVYMKKCRGKQKNYELYYPQNNLFIGQASVLPPLPFSPTSLYNPHLNLASFIFCPLQICGQTKLWPKPWEPRCLPPLCAISLREGFSDSKNYLVCDVVRQTCLTNAFGVKNFSDVLRVSAWTTISQTVYSEHLAWSLWHVNQRCRVKHASTKSMFCQWKLILTKSI